MRQFKVAEQDEGQRVDVMLSQLLGLSRRQVHQLLEYQQVQLNQRMLNLKAKGWHLASGDQLSINDYQSFENVVPEPEASLDILLDQQDLLFVNKPAGQPVRPKKPFETGSLLNAALGRYPELQGVGEAGLKSAVVHRLDTDTSGVLLLAKSEARWQQARLAFKEHRTVKHYQALVVGKMSGQGQESLALEVYQHKPARVRVVHKDSKQSRPCRLRWRVMEQFASASLLDITLETGFLHQIRVMLAYLGHPVIGDAVYGQGQLLADRQLLHASSLRVLGLEVQCPLADDFQDVLRGLRT